MSWLNKFLRIFQDKEEHTVLEEKPINYENKSRSDIRGKEIDTKIVYQYPKGNFRFPLIPDEEQLKLQMRNKEKRYKEASTSSETSRKHSVNKPNNQEVRRPLNEPKVQESSRPKIPVQKERSYPSREREQSQQTNRLAGSNKISKKSSRPFQPTEIPSPIYGFTKRPIQTEMVEFELKEEEAFIGVDRVTTPFVDENIQEKFHENPAEILFYKNKNIENIEDDYDQTNNSFVDTDDKYIENSNDSVEIINGVETSTEEMEDVLYIDEEYKVQEIDEVLLEEVTIEETVYEEGSHPLTDDQIEDEEYEQAPNKLEEKQNQSRSHIPFNVLMLKQDKRFLEQKVIEKKVEIPTHTENPHQQTEDRGLLETFVKKNEPPLSDSISESYSFPGMELLNPPVTRFAQENVEWIDNQEHLLNEALKNFGVRASVVNITQGPSVTRFEVQPEPGVKVNKITNLSDDIKLSLAAKDIRIEAPIPGKHTIGIEVPNKKSRPVLISEIIKTDAFRNSSSPLTAVLGLDISGAPIVTDLKKMPHGLIAGATGSGKSVCINSILISLLYKASPQELKLLLIDPKMVELAPYNHIPHLVSPVITDVKAATAALKWAVDEMERRYELFAHAGVRDINRFNEIAEAHKRYSEKLPFIVIIIDELADLMMMSPADVEESICRIAQKARACGIHLIIATQRPSVDVITGLIKANVPTRTAFSVSSQIDSRTIIDISGAEKLLGRGDMLFLENGSSKPVRLQGTFVSDAEIDLVVEHVRGQMEPQYLFHQEELLKKAQVVEEEDELFYEACEFVIDQGGASTSSLQRRFKIGYNRAARLIDMMEQQGFISEPKGSKPRDVLISAEELEQIQETSSSTFL